MRERERRGPCENKATCGLDFLVFFFLFLFLNFLNYAGLITKLQEICFSKPTFKDCFQLTDELIVVLEENLHEQ